jgi:EpsI family protein
VGTNNGLEFLRGRPARVLTALLVLQAIGLYAVSRSEPVQAVKPLSTFPTSAGMWSAVQDHVLDAPTMEVLRADDVLSRSYVEPQAGTNASLFVAYFKTQRAGQVPHSPKNCLPGAGWVPSESAVVSIDVPGRAEPIRVNQYIVAKGEESSVVLYWYQTHKRVIASDYMAKLYLVLDSIRYNRSDTALVRVVVPARGNPEQAAEAAKRFVRAVFAPVSAYFPS